MEPRRVVIKQGPLAFRDYVVTGLTALLPAWLTVYILWFLVSLVGGLVHPILRPILRRLLAKSPPEALMVLVSAAIVCFLVWGTGYLVVHVIGHGQITRIDALIARVPVASTIHSILRRLLELLFSGKGSFQSVVRVEFPMPGQYAIGFVTSEDLNLERERDSVSVLVPTAPNPTSGFLLVVPKSRLRFLKMTVDEAMAFVVSMGTFGPRVLTAPEGEREGS